MFTQAFCVFIDLVKIRVKGYLFKVILSANIKMLNWQSFSLCESGLQVCQWVHRIFVWFLLEVHNKTSAFLFVLYPHFINAWTFFIIFTKNISILFLEKPPILDKERK